MTLPAYLSDERVDPFTGEEYPNHITEEIHQSIPLTELGYSCGIRLFEYPQKPIGLETYDDKFKLWQYNGGSGMYDIPMVQIDQTDEPSSGQFKVSWNSRRAILKMNVSDLAKLHKMEYYGLGSMLEAALFYAIPPGCMIWFYVLTGGWTIIEMVQLGFAIMNGTTALSQGVTDPLITGTLPDLVTDKRFIRADSTSGTTQEDAVQQEIENATHGHGLTDPQHAHGPGNNQYYNYWVSDDNSGGPDNTHGGLTLGHDWPNGLFKQKDINAPTGISVVNSTSLDFSSAGVRLAAETRPKNITAIPLLKVK